MSHYNVIIGKYLEEIISLKICLRFSILHPYLGLEESQAKNKSHLQNATYKSHLPYATCANSETIQLKNKH